MSLLDLVPMWFRSRWPLKRYYWQADEMERIEAEAQRLWDIFGGDGPQPDERRDRG